MQQLWYEKLGRNWLLRKLLTRPVRWWERHRPVPEREKIFGFPPIAIPREGHSELLVLLTPDFIPEAAWCARSILSALPEPPCLLFVCDGTWPPDRARQLEVIFPGCSRRATSRIVSDTKQPLLAKFASSHALGRKLASIIARQRERNVVYCDADVIAFNALSEVADFLRSPEVPLFIQEEGGVNTDPVLLHRLNTLNLPYSATINTGFMCIPKLSLDVPLVEQVLESVVLDNLSWFCETTLFAALMERAAARPLPRDKYVVSTQRQFFFEDDVDYERICLRHFVTPVRHLIGLRALPLIAKRLG